MGMVTLAMRQAQRPRSLGVCWLLWESMTAHTPTPSGSGLATVRLRLNPPRRTLSVTNGVPTASLSGPTNGVAGSRARLRSRRQIPRLSIRPRALSLPSNWGDGHTDTVTALTGTPGVHRYSTPGSYTISLPPRQGQRRQHCCHAVDHHRHGPDTRQRRGLGGTTGDDTFLLTPVSASQNEGHRNAPCWARLLRANGTFLLYGDGGNDTVTVNGRPATTRSRSRAVPRHERFTCSFDGMQSVTLDGLAGADTFTNTNATISSVLTGVGGNDTFTFAGGGMGATAQILGGAGNNTLIVPT